ncbi:glycosyltransferase family 4 protein [Profundibacter sp.]
MSAAPLAVIVKGWPRLSETFIAQELVALEEAGQQFDIWSLRFPTDKKRHPLHDRLTANIRYLPEYLHQEPMRVLRAYLKVRKLAGFKQARALWQFDYARDKTRNRIRRFGQACVLAAEMPGETLGLYAHFMHTPSSVARYGAAMCGLPWAFSAHAKDIWTSPEWEKREKLSDATCGATFGATCTAFGADHLRELADTPDRIHLIYHGLDLSRFPAPPKREPTPAGSIRLLSVGRLVEKKGFDNLIDALALLPAELDWRWIHIGGGELKSVMQERAERAGISNRIEWLGALNQPEVIEQMRAADIFVLPSRIAKDGDRDGLPNVLMEAASQLLPIISTPVSAIPEFIDTGVHGILTSDAAEPLAEAIHSLALDPDKRAQMAKAANARLRRDFTMMPGINQLDKLLRQMCGQA